MKEINIQPTDRTPSMVFKPDEGYLCFEGKAIPENAIAYFRPIVEGLKVFVDDPSPDVLIEIKLMYINTASWNVILELLKGFEQKVKEGITKVIVHWYCDAEDGDMIDCVKDATQYLSDLNIKVCIEDE